MKSIKYVILFLALAFVLVGVFKQDPIRTAHAADSVFVTSDSRTDGSDGVFTKQVAEETVFETAQTTCKNGETADMCCIICEKFCSDTVDLNMAPIPSASIGPFSIIDNGRFAYYHWAFDYAPQSNSGCGPCGASAPNTGSLPSLKIHRFIRPRDKNLESSFGPGVFSNWDLRLQIFDATRPGYEGTKIADIFDPSVTRPQRFSDGPYKDYWMDHKVTSDDVVVDGVYSSFRSKESRSLTLFDAADQVTSDQNDAVRAELLLMSGRKTYFDLFTLGGTRYGRVTRAEDRNGYGTDITYHFGVGDTQGRQWQIDTVTDPHGISASYIWDTVQHSGRWVCNEIQMPNSTSVLYSYTNGYLSDVDFPDGTATTITKGFNTTSGKTTFEIFDAAASEGHRSKTIHLSGIYAFNEPGVEGYVWSSDSLCRLVVNGEDEVAYMNFPGAVATKAIIYEGKDRLKEVNTSYTVDLCKYFQNWTISFDYAEAWDATTHVTGTREPKFDKYTFFDAKSHRQNKPTESTSRTGVHREYGYNADVRTTNITYDDATEERFTYNNFIQPTVEIDRLNRVTQYTYDSRGNMLSKTKGREYIGGQIVDNGNQISTWTWEYYPSGHTNQFLLHKAIDARGNETEFIYDSNHFLIQVKEPEDDTGTGVPIIDFTYDTAGRIKTAQDAVNRETEYFYDSRSRVDQIQYHDDSTETFTFGSGADANLVVESKDRNGNVTKFEYDTVGRKEKITEAFGTSVAVETTCNYVPGTRLRSDCVEKGERTDFVYDFRKRLVEKTVQTSNPSTPEALTYKWRYNKNLLIEKTDPYGRGTFYGYTTTVDRYLIRTIVETEPGYFGANYGNNQTTLLNETRSTNNNARFVITDRTVDVENQLLKITDGRSIEHTNVYDSQGRLESRVVADSDDTVEGKYEYDYDVQGNVIEERTPRHFDVTETDVFRIGYTYGGRNLVKTKTEGLGSSVAATMSYTYYLDRRARDTVDFRGNTWTKFWHECCGRYLGSKDPEGSGDISSTDFFGNITHTAVVDNADDYFVNQTSDPHDPVNPLNEVTIKYDARHRPIARTIWLVEISQVDPNAVPIAGDGGIPAADGLTTRWVYDDDLTDNVGLDLDYASHMAGVDAGLDSDFYAVEMTNPEDESTLTIYDGAGRVVYTVDPLDHNEQVIYDELVTKTTFEGGTASGELLEVSYIDGLGHVTKSLNDGAGRTHQTVDELSKVIDYEFDANSNRVKVRDPNGVGIDCIFDSRNRDVECEDTDGDTTKKVFDRESNVTVYKDGFNNPTNCNFDSRNRKIKSISRVGGETIYTYDANNNIDTITDGDGRTTTYVYDKRNLKTEEIFATHSVTRYDKILYEYDGARRLTKRTDQQLHDTEFVFDRANRLTSREYPDNQDDTFTYDAASRLLTATSARYNNTVTRVYDDDSRLTSETINVGGNSRTVSFGYDADDRKTSITYPNLDVVDRNYTVRDELEEVKYNSSSLIDNTYDDGMRLTQTDYGNGLTENRTYNMDNTVATIKVAGVTDYTFTYDQNKRRIQELNNINALYTKDHSYDAEDRLTGWDQNGVATQDWTLTKVGDWSQVVFQDLITVNKYHNEAHELTQDGTRSLTYDLKGNTVYNQSKRGMAWDFDNQLTTVTNDSLTTLATYEYDALGRRVEMVTADGTTYYHYDGAQILAEYNGSNQLVQNYAFASYIDDACAMIKPNGTTYYYHRDAIFNTRALTDGTGTVVEYVEYTAYGNPSMRTGGGSAIKQSLVENEYLFQGRRWDAVVYLYYFRSRYYDSGLGRFVQRDKPGIWFDTSNLGNGYGFAGNDPINKVDPMGMIDPIQPNAGDTDWNSSIWGPIHPPSSVGQSDSAYESDWDRGNYVSPDLRHQRDRARAADPNNYSTFIGLTWAFANYQYSEQVNLDFGPDHPLTKAMSKFNGVTIARNIMTKFMQSICCENFVEGFEGREGHYESIIERDGMWELSSHTTLGSYDVFMKISDIDVQHFPVGWCWEWKFIKYTINFTVLNYMNWTSGTRKPNSKTVNYNDKYNLKLDKKKSFRVTFSWSEEHHARCTCWVVNCDCPQGNEIGVHVGPKE